MKKTTRRRRLVHREQFVPYLMGRVHKQVASAASVLYRKRLGVGINDSRIVLTLARQPNITAKEVSADTGLNKAIVSRSLSVLRRKGIVRYTGESVRRELELTPHGASLHDRISDVALQREHLLLKGFSTDEKVLLCDFLHRMLTNVPKANAYDPLGPRRASKR